ncbi:MAG: leucine-rich repeat protein [Clostridia bacterium]|nr:leucine-rich repeat protein [Clostridia bacterium]
MKKKRILFVLLSLLLIFTMVSSLAVPASAAVANTSFKGEMQDTAIPGSGKVYWEYTFNRSTGRASLRIWGNGYMPNGTDQDWFAVQQSAQCYIYNVTIEEGVKSIMSNAFAGEIYLKNVTLPSSIELIGEGAFSYTAIEKFNIPAKVKYIDSSCFSGSPISAFTVDSANPYYKSYNGNIYSKDMTELVAVAPLNYSGDVWNGFSFPSSVTSIGKYAFMGCPIESVTIPGHIKAIKKMAFAGCYDLSSIVICNGVEGVYDSAFLSCDSLRNVQLPASVNYLGFCAFGYTYDYDYAALKDMLDYKNIPYGSINENNFEYYASLTGFGADAFISCVTDRRFHMYAPVGSVGERYARNNELDYYRSAELLSATSGYDGVVLKWRDSPEVSHYNIYRKENGTWRQINTRTNGFTTYLDSDIYEAGDFSYALEVCYYSGYKHFDKIGINTHYVPAPVLKSIANNVGGLRVNWYGVIGAKYYYVYRKAVGESSWKYLKCVPGNVNTYLDNTASNGKDYIYTVRAYDGKGTSGFDANGLRLRYVEAPEFKVYNNTSTIALSWNKVENADYYNVYRKVGSGSWVLLKTLGGSSAYYRDDTASRGGTYTYTVRAINDGVYSCFYPQGKTLKSIDAPMSIKLENRVSGVMLNWNKCAGADGYYVYRKTASGSWLRIATVTGNANVTYLDTAAKSGQTYTYTVKAFSGPYHSTYVLNGVSIKFLATPKISSAVSTKNGVSLKFNTVSGADGYYVYRKTVTGTWVLIGKSAAGAYIDTAAQKGASYIYTVRAYNGSTRSSYYANGNTVKVVY